MDDGEYSLICSSGSISTEDDYHKYTLSIALRTDSGGYGAYVADYISGKPVDSCTLDLLDAEGILITSADGFSAADGFGQMPDTGKRSLWP